MSLSNYPSGAEYDPYCPWNAKEDEDDDEPETCEFCGAELDENGDCPNDEEEEDDDL